MANSTAAPLDAFCPKPEKICTHALTAPRPAASCALLPRAQMAELVDAPASGAGDRKVVEVRVLFWAPSTRPGECADG